VTSSLQTILGRKDYYKQKNFPNKIALTR